MAQSDILHLEWERREYSSPRNILLRSLWPRLEVLSMDSSITTRQENIRLT